MSENILLPEKLDQAAAPELYASLAKVSGHSVNLDGRAVRGLGGLCGQILVAASKKWEADGKQLTSTCSDPMKDDLKRLGLDMEFVAEVASE